MHPMWTYEGPFKKTVKETNPSNVAGGGQTEPSDQTSAHVGKDVTVEIWHDHDTVCVRLGIGDNLYLFSGEGIERRM
jgi:hypothetical protein